MITINSNLKKTLDNEMIFTYKKNGYYFRKGIFNDKPIKELYKDNPEHIIDLLDKIYEEGNRLTKYIISDVKKEIKENCGG